MWVHGGSGLHRGSEVHGAVGYIGEMGSGAHSKAVGAWRGLVLGRRGMVLGGSWDSVA